MVNSKPIPTEPSSPKSNRGLVIFLVGAIACVLAVGIWLLTGHENQPAYPRSAPVRASSTGDFYMPAEFEAQEFLILGGEHLVSRYPDIMTDIVGGVVRQVRVVLLANSAQGKSAMDSLMMANGLDRIPVENLSLPELSMWVRDFGPLTVTDLQGRRSMVAFDHTGGRGTRFDENVPTYLSIQLDLALLENGLQLEGGDLITNGRGFAVMSSRVVDRNAGYRDKETPEIVQSVAALLGLETVLLVPQLVGEKSGHADRFITFLAPDLVVVGSLDAAGDAANADQLDRIARDLDGTPTLAGPLRVERIPQPDHTDGSWRSYTSVVFANGVLLVPVYPDYCPDLDEKALALYRRLLPDRMIVAIDASHLMREDGTLRGITMNVPVGGPLDPSEAAPRQ